MTLTAAARRLYEAAQRTLDAKVSRLPDRTQRWVRSGARGADQLARRGWNLGTLSPLVTIVVPVYNVDRFLAECLESILCQSHRRLEVLVVDDGSEDRSTDILQAYAARDHRIRILSQPHAGLGAARNHGADHARGRYLMFVDADDVLLPDAVAAYVRSLRISGSSFAVGAYRRLSAAGTTSAAHWVAGAHREVRRGTSIREFPEIQVNAVAWSKFYRRSFWRKAELQFPVGVLYEDQVVSSRAYAQAKRFDVLSRVTYLWRIREDRSSITQREHEVGNLSARIAAALSSLHELDASGVREAREIRLSQILSNDVPLWIRAAEYAEPEFWEVLKLGLSQLTAMADDRVWSRVQPQHRVTIELARSDKRSDLLHFNGLGRNEVKSAPSILIDGRLFTQLPARTALGLEPQSELLALTPDQTSVITGTRRVFWRPDGRIEIHGWAYIDNLDLSTAQPRITLVLTDPADPGDVSIDVPTAATHDPEVTARSRHKYANYENATFRAVLDPDQLVRGRGNGRWVVEVRVEALGLLRTARLGGLQPTGSPGHLPGRLTPGGLVRLSFTRRRGLVLTVSQPPVTLERADLRERLLTVAVHASPGFEPRTLELKNDVSGFRLTAPFSGQAGSRISRIEIPLTDTAVPVTRSGFEPWTVRVAGSDGRWTPVAVAKDLPGTWDPTTAGLRVRLTQYGNLGLVQDHSTLVIDHLSTEDESQLVLSGRWFGLDPDCARHVEIQLRTPSGGCNAPVGIGEDCAFRSVLELTTDSWGTGKTLLRSGHYVLAATHVCQHDDPDSEGVAPTTVSAGYEVIATLPLTLLSARFRGEVRLAGNDGLGLLVEPPLQDDERGARNQENMRRQLEQRRHSRSFEPGAVLFRSYYGEISGCNPRAIHDELRRRNTDHKLYWTVRDHSVAVPDGGIPVVYESAEWYRLLHDAEYYIDNMHQAIYHDKPAHQIQVQTLHGYPFKRMGRSHWRHQRRSMAHIESYLQRAADWDFLVSPATYATEPLRTEFGFPNEVLEIGYPRNDVFFSPDADLIRTRVRSRLGIREDQTALLYAPTFRDNLARHDFTAPMSAILDLAEFSAALGDAFVVLVRGHAFNARRAERVGSYRNIVDVTDYPDVNELGLASDAAILDYSSLRFDYGLTGKPMIYLVPDLAEYVGTYRGALFAYEPTAPGPLVTSSDEAADAVLNLAEISAKYAHAYAAFQQTFLDLDDGKASARLVDRVFES